MCRVQCFWSLFFVKFGGCFSEFFHWEFGVYRSLFLLYSMLFKIWSLLLLCPSISKFSIEMNVRTKTYPKFIKTLRYRKIFLQLHLALAPLRLTVVLNALRQILQTSVALMNIGTLK
uniref:Uncharacterized protein n=1 Tax=Ixodes ricinus TaxID=34613 RepID=A0A147BFJ3_IXORI